MPSNADVEKLIDDFQSTLDRIESNKRPRTEFNIDLKDLKETLVTMQDTQEQLLSDSRDIVDAVKAIKIEVPTIPDIKVPAPEVTVNVPEIKVPQAKVDMAFPKEMDVKKPSWFNLSELSDIKTILKDLTKSLFSIRLPNKADEAIPVRLSDGKNFIESLTKVISGGGGGGAIVRHTFKNPTSSSAQAKLTADDILRVQVENPSASPETGLATAAKQDDQTTLLQGIAGFTLSGFDYIAATYPDTSTEVYTYKVGGAGGTVVSVITVVYSDAVTKSIITSVTKT